MKLTRSQFFKVVIGGSAWLVSSGFAQRIRNAVDDRARPLPLDAVRLTGGPLKRAQDLDAQYLFGLAPARMLAPYRRRAGLPPNGEPYPGWDAGGRNLTGHICGHYLSAVSLMFAATGDSRFKDRAETSSPSSRSSRTRGAMDSSARSRACAMHSPPCLAAPSFGQLRSERAVVAWYTLHKTYAGLRDAYRHTGNRAALDVETRFAGWAESILRPMTGDQIQRMLNTEFGGMNEVLADLYADTGDRRWLELSYRFEHDAVLDPLKRGEDPLDGLHGNTQVPKLIGSAARYAYAGNEADRAAATLFWDRVAHHHTFASGGHGKDEYFREPDNLGHITDGRTAETCNVYNMLKLTRRLFALEPDVAVRRVPRARAVQPHPRLDRCRRRRHVLHGAGRPRRATRVSGHEPQLHLLRRHRHGEPRAPRPRHLLRIRRSALGEHVRAVDGAMGSGRCHARDGHDVSRRRDRQR